VIHVAKLQLDFYHFPYQPVHTSGFLGQGSGFVQQDMMAEIKVMFRHCQNLRFLQSAMVVAVFINPDTDAETSSSYVQLPTSVGFLPPPGASILSLGKKVKFTPEQATKTQRGSRGIALLFF
jgi:hypothetical protein